jgi:hypothetical protein
MGNQCRDPNDQLHSPAWNRRRHNHLKQINENSRAMVPNRNSPVKPYQLGPLYITNKQTKGNCSCDRRRARPVRSSASGRDEPIDSIRERAGTTQSAQAGVQHHHKQARSEPDSPGD